MKRTTKYTKTEFLDRLTHEGKKYIREETIMDDDDHIICWEYQVKDENYRQGGPLFYFSSDMGWGGNYPNGKVNLSKDNPIPEIELIFQKEIRRPIKIKKIQKTLS